MLSSYNYLYCFMVATSIQLRPAGINDLAILQHWDKQAHVIESDPNDDWDWETELLRTPHWRQQLIAELDGRPIGFVQIIDPAEEETHYWGDVPQNLRAIDIWIGESEDLNKGYGTQMMQQAIELCFEPPEVTTILIDPLESNVGAHRFYERLGFQFKERKQLGDDLCRVYQLGRHKYIEQ